MENKFDPDAWLKAVIGSAEAGTGDSHESARILLNTFCWQVDRLQQPDWKLLEYLSRAFRKAEAGTPIDTALGLRRKKGKPKASVLRDANIAVFVKRLMIGCLTDFNLLTNLHVSVSEERLKECIETHKAPRGRTLEEACDFIGHVCNLGPDVVKKIYCDVKKLMPEAFAATTQAELEKRLYG